MIAKRQIKQKDIAPYSRLLSFESAEHMERHDREIMALVEKHEEHRHRCEVLTLIRRRINSGDWAPVQSFLSLARKKRGNELADRLARDIKAQWRAGNRGKKGDWRTE